MRAVLNFLKDAFTTPLGYACLFFALAVIALVFGVGSGEAPQFENAG